MPDLRPGRRIRALDFPPAVTDDEPASFTFNATAFGIDNDSGSYAECGVAFLAGTTGRAKIDFAGAFDNDNAAAFTLLVPVVREGATIGSGATVVPAADDNAISIGSTIAFRIGGHIFVEGLTPGSTYNARLEHRVTGGVGTLLRRIVTVTPAT